MCYKEVKAVVVVVLEPLVGSHMQPVHAYVWRVPCVVSPVQINKAPCHCKYHGGARSCAAGAAVAGGLCVADRHDDVFWHLNDLLVQQVWAVDVQVEDLGPCLVADEQQV